MGFADVLESYASGGEGRPALLRLLPDVHAPRRAGRRRRCRVVRRRRGTSRRDRPRLPAVSAHGRDALYETAREDTLLLLRALRDLVLVDDFLADNGDFGAQTFLVTSASSKTAIALAFCLGARGASEVVG